MGIEDGYIEIKNKIRMGPIIHQTFDSINKVVVIAEFSEPGDITCKLFELDSKGNKIGKIPSRMIQQNLKYMPTFSYNTSLLFRGTFEDLKQGRTYQIEFDQDLSSDRIGKFRIIKEEQDNINFAFVSCNDIKINKKIYDAWIPLKEQAKQTKIDIIFHMGDQIYADKIFKESVRLLKSMLKETYSTIDEFYQTLQSFYDNNYDKSKVDNKNLERFIEVSTEIGEKFDSLYRDSWEYGPTKYLLRNNLNIMIRDDHEIRDGVYKPDLTDPISNYVAKAGLEHAQQKQMLGRNPLKEIYFEIGKHGFMFLDTRSALIEPDNKREYLGEEQNRLIKLILKDNGVGKDIKNMFVISTIPVVSISEKMTNWTSHIIPDSKGQWEYSRGGATNLSEQTDLLSQLFEWKNRNNKRNVVLISGDYHMSGFTDITNRDGDKIKQIVSSPIKKIFTTWWSLGLFEVFYKILLIFFSKKLPNDVKVKHYDWNLANNFGLIIIDNKKNKKDQINGLIHSITQFTGREYEKSIELSS